ncbi:MAG: hypothetical protein ACK46M_16665 [Planctomyces sp.]|jgi:hypothetical protein
MTKDESGVSRINPETLQPPRAMGDSSGQIRWYRLEFHTLRSGEGGTNANVFFKFRGTICETGWLWLDSPGDSHERGDIDIYFVANPAIGDFEDWDISLQTLDLKIDNWTYKLWIDEYDIANAQWRLKYVMERTSYSIRQSEGEARIIRGLARWAEGAVHVDADDPGNPIVEERVPLPFDCMIHRPFDA